VMLARGRTHHPHRVKFGKVAFRNAPSTATAKAAVHHMAKALSWSGFRGFW